MAGKLSKKVLGLDIRSNAISAVLVKSSLKGLFIEDNMHIEIQDSMGAEGNGHYSGQTSDPVSGLSSALASLVSNMDISGAVCVASFPFNHLSFRNLQVPFREKKKIRQILPFELEPLLPFPIEDVLMDFNIVKHESQTNGTDLIVAAIQQNELKSYLDVLKSYQIDPKSVTISGYMTAMRLAEQQDSKGGAVLVDIDQTNASIYGIISNQIEIVRCFPVPTGSSERQQTITSHISHTILASEARFGTDGIFKEIFLTGPGVKNTDFEQYLEKQLNIPVYRLNLIKDGAVSLVNPVGTTWVPAQSDTALGLCLTETEGLRGFNFRKGPFAIQKFWMDHASDLILTSSLVAVLLLFLGLGFVTESFKLQKEIDAVKHQIRAIFKSTFPDIQMTQYPLEQMRAEIGNKKKSTLFTEETKTDVRTMDILNDMSRLIPEKLDVKFIKIVISAGSVLITGTTDTFNSVDEMKNRLEKATIFDSVTITSANMDRSGNRVDFKLKIQLG